MSSTKGSGLLRRVGFLAGLVTFVLALWVLHGWLRRQRYRELRGALFSMPGDALARAAVLTHSPLTARTAPARPHITEAARACSASGDTKGLEIARAQALMPAVPYRGRSRMDMRMDPSLECATDPAGTVLPVPTADALLSLIQTLMGELRGSPVPPPALDDDLEHALGIDSLARMELLMRLEQGFGVRLPDDSVQQARTPRELLQALEAVASGTAVVETHAVRGGVPPMAAAVPHEIPLHARTLVEVLEWHASQAGERCPVRLLYGPRGVQTLNAAELLGRAHRLAGALQRQGLERGEAVALMLPTSVEFLQAFMAILVAGGVPVPIYPPLRPDQVEDHLRRQVGILSSAQAALLVTDSSARPAARLLRVATPGLRAVVTVEQLRACSQPCTPVALAGTDTALLQYTSGSTGQPKGVVLTHANLLANIRAMGQALAVGAQDRFVSWLPLYHDMGLIGAWLGTLYHGVPLILMPPQAFLGRPSRWLQVISDHRATLSAAPNFAYEILAAKVPDAELQGLDLSRWRAALNGAEPVQAATLERFAQRLHASGFDPKALMPVYGLAESAVGLTFSPLGRGPRIDRIDGPLLHCQAVAQPVGPGHADAVSVVGCGVPLSAHEVRVVDAHGSELADRHEGRIEFRGPSAAEGYFRSPQATQELLREGGWRDTGDLGYVADGELFPTGRAKDLIIRGGHNIHPEDLEQAVGELPGVRRGCVAVIGAPDVAAGTQRVVVVAETRVEEPAARKSLQARIARLALERLGLPADDVVLARPHAIPKTSSGKIRRAACRELYERGRLEQPPLSMALQMARLWLAALGAWLRGARQRIGEFLFGVRAWALFGLGAGLSVWAALLPGRRMRKHVARGLARAGLAAAGLRPQARGSRHLAGGPWLFVCNHASYLDWLVLTAVLPASACFVAKQELHHGAVGWVLRRMGVHFVAREAVGASVADARCLVQAAQNGESLVFFPEGTLSRAPGLMPFHLGAFMAAAQSGQPVLPVSLRGTRSALRDGCWWPRRSDIAVTLHAPLQAEGLAWEQLIRLRDAARQRIAAACGEPLRDA